MTDHFAPFFDVLKGSKKFEWTKKCEKAFQALNKHLGHPSFLSKPIEGEKLYLYLIVSEEAVIAALVREEGKIQWLVYYMSKRLLDSETKYPELGKVALALMVTSRKRRPYFYAYSIEVLTNYLLRQVLQKPEVSGRLLNWVIELGQFNVNFHSRTGIIGQALTDFIIEFTYASTAKVAGIVDGIEAAKVVEIGNKGDSAPTQEDTQQWTFSIDGASSENGSAAGMMLISPKGHEIHCALRFGFQASNNKAEYKALIAGLCLTRELQAWNLRIYNNDSQLVVNQVNGIYLTRRERMAPI